MKLIWVTNTYHYNFLRLQFQWNNEFVVYVFDSFLTSILIEEVKTMAIENVICTINGRHMTLLEVARHEEHNEVKQHLECATDGCIAKMSYVSNSVGRKDYFKSVRSNSHSPSCDLQLEKEALIARTKANETIATTISEKGIQSRINDFHKKRMAKDNGEEVTTKPRGTRGKTSDVTDTNKKRGVLVSIGDPLPEEPSKDGSISSPQVLKRELNQISEKDENKIRHIASSIRKITKTKNGFEAELFLGKSKATLVITEAFLKGNQDNEVITYLNSLKEFLDSRAITEPEISVYVFAQLKKYLGNETVIFAYDSEQFRIFIPGATRNPIKLDLFEALYTRNSLK